MYKILNNIKLINVIKKKNLKKFKNIQNINYLNDKELIYYFKKSCLYNSVDILNYIIDESNIKFIIPYNFFFKIIKKKFLNILKILYDKNILFPNNGLFCIACCYDLNISIWLSQFENIDIHFYNELPLYNACICQEINIIKWLISLDADYEIENDLIFRDCCKNYKLKTLNYLCSISERYDYCILNYKIIIHKIKEKISDIIIKKKWSELINRTKINIIENNNFELEICSISLEPSNFKTNCNHHFNFKSFMLWYNIKKICPYCKNKIILNQCFLDSNAYFDILLNC